MFMSVIYYDVSANAHPAYNSAATYGAILLILTSTLFYLYYRSLRSSSRYQVVTGRGYSSQVISIGKWKYATFAAMITYFFITVIAPFVVVVMISLAPFWNPYAMFAHLSLKNYQYLFAPSTGIFPIITRSVLSSGIGATVVAMLALTITFIVYRTKLRGRYNLERLGMLPLTIPSLLIGYGLLWAFLTIKTNLYGTIGGTHHRILSFIPSSGNQGHERFYCPDSFGPRRSVTCLWCGVVFDIEKHNFSASEKFGYRWLDLRIHSQFQRLLVISFCWRLRKIRSSQHTFGPCTPAVVAQLRMEISPLHQWFL